MPVCSRCNSWTYLHSNGFTIHDLCIQVSMLSIKNRKNFCIFQGVLIFSTLSAKEQYQEVESSQWTIVLQRLFCPTSHNSMLNSRVAQSSWFTFHLFKEGSDLLHGYLFVRLEWIACSPFSPNSTASWVPAEAPSEVGKRDWCKSSSLSLSLWMRLSHSGGRKVMNEFQGRTSVSSFRFSLISLDLFGKFSFLCHALSGFFLHSCLNFLVLYPFLLCHSYLSRWLKLAFPDKELNQTSRSTEWKE